MVATSPGVTCTSAIPDGATGVFVIVGDPVVQARAPSVWSAGRRDIMRAWRIASAAWIALAAALIGAPAARADADVYPSRPVRIIAPFPPGGPVDMLTRVLAEKLTAQLGQQVVVDNRPGAGGMIGAEAAARSRPDGYTLVMVSTGFAINATLMKRLPFDPAGDFEPIALVATTPIWIVVDPQLPVRNVRELIAHARANPGKLAYAGTSGTVTHLGVELFKTAHNIDMLFVPYKGSGPAITDMIGGQIQVMFDNIPSTLPFVRAGKLRALAVTSAKRVASAPDVPSIAEEGLAGSDIVGWYGLMAPAGTDKGIVRKLNEQVRAALASEEVKARIQTIGADIAAGSAADFAAFVKSEIVRWGDVVVKSGARPE